MSSLVAEDAALAVLTDPGERLHARGVLTGEQDLATLACVWQRVRFIDHCTRAGSPRYRVIECDIRCDAYAEFVTTLAIADPNDLVPLRPLRIREEGVMKNDDPLRDFSEFGKSRKRLSGIPFVAFILRRRKHHNEEHDGVVRLANLFGGRGKIIDGLNVWIDAF